MTVTWKLPKHILSKTEPRAQHAFECVWQLDGCRKTIHRGDIYVRMVWQDENDDVYSDHICVECWSKD